MNAVAQLKEYHDKCRTGNPPGYTYEPDPQTKLFRATCFYRNRETFGIGLSKRDSQRAAADEMLKKLNITPKAPVIETIPRMISRVSPLSALSSTAARKIEKVLTEDEKLKAYRFLAEYGDKDPNNDSRKSMAPDQHIIDQVDMGLKSEDRPKSDTLAHECQNADSIDTFKQIMKELKLKFCCKVPEIKPDVESEHIVLIQIHYRIHLMAGGVGDSVELATYAACEKAITMLKIYTN